MEDFDKTSTKTCLACALPCAGRERHKIDRNGLSGRDKISRNDSQMLFLFQSTLCLRVQAL